MLFLLYINDFSEGLNSNVQLFADNTYFFSVVHDPSLTTETFNEDLSKVSQWTHQRKMLFNLDHLKQAKKLYFLGRIERPIMEASRLTT